MPRFSLLPRRLVFVAAFGAIYLIWGSTYLAIRVGIETIPPFLLAGSRFFVAGLLLYAWARPRARRRPTLAQWREATVLGGLMLLGGNGMVTWAEQYVASSVAALVITTVPLWMVLLERWMFGGAKLRRPLVLGLAMGFVGVAVLMAPTGSDLAGVHPAGALGLLFAAFSWALGSLRSRRGDTPSSPTLAVSMQMTAGGALLLLLALARGEMTTFSPGAVSASSWWSMGYLIVFGSIVALSAYTWLLRETTASAVSTYAFVNPVVAVILGAALAGEPFGPRTLLAGGLIVGAVVAVHVSLHASRRRVGTLSGARGEPRDVGSDRDRMGQAMAMAMPAPTSTVEPAGVPEPCPTAALKR